ncbi:MAG: DUF91 domain-containing protein [Candidatus Bathyarchaeota archaeon]|nr:MAG: DUF91 domain-containing protein [Candidatus Bathyarchaeota archaeon]
MSIEEIRIKNELQLGQMVVEEIESIEAGLTTIANEIPINAETKLDVLCHDESGQLVIFELGTSEDDIMLFEGLKALNQLDTVKHMLKFHYKDFKISDSKPPRLVLLAPSFSKNLLTIVNHISGIRIDLYEWEYLRFGDNKGLRIRPICISTETEGKRKHAHERKPKKQKAESFRKAEEQQSPQEVISEPKFDASVSVEPEDSLLKIQPETEKKKEKPKKKSILRF